MLQFYINERNFSLLNYENQFNFLNVFNCINISTRFIILKLLIRSTIHLSIININPPLLFKLQLQLLDDYKNH